MHRLVSSNHVFQARSSAASVIAMVFALCAVVFLFAGCAPAAVPVTGKQPESAVAGDQAVKAAPAPNVVIGAQPDNAPPWMPRAGEAKSNGAQPEAAAAKMPLANPAPGAIYHLVTNERGISVGPTGKTVPQSVTYNVGAGYQLVITASGNWLLPPADSSMKKQRVDLGQGNALVITDGQGRTQSSGSEMSLSSLPHDPNVTVQYIGNGFWLVTHLDERWILQE